jgi:hypothetical protein
MKGRYRQGGTLAAAPLHWDLFRLGVTNWGIYHLPRYMRHVIVSDMTHLDAVQLIYLVIIRTSNAVLYVQKAVSA